MNVSIAIPTYNRAAEVEKTLATLAHLDLAGCPDHEILVIDNNSTDATPVVVERMTPLFGGRLRCVRETQQGLNHARNRAIQEARHEIVAYLDDDVDVDPKWLRHLSEAYASGDIAGVGGRAYLVYPGPKPQWLGESIEGLLTKVELGPKRRPAGVDEIYGVNLSFRKDWLHRAGGFRPDLDRVGTRLTGGGDDEMIRRVIALGGVMLYEPGAAVGHRVPPGRMRRKWFWNRCLWGGVTEARLWPNEQVTLYQLLRATWHVGLMSWRTFRAGLWNGPRSAVCFRQALNVATRTGIWAGLLSELWRRRWRGSRSSEPVTLTLPTSISPDRQPSTRESLESREVVLG
ncbi:MAG: glycosyltransferase family 2 protein [Planctomycetia bacterium]|nr:glycosyltransferase family 2 protein [Planctomycetia bacterium]